MVEIPLATLFSNATRKKSCNIRPPFSAVLRHESNQLLVLLFRPRSFDVSPRVPIHSKQIHRAKPWWFYRRSVVP